MHWLAGNPAFDQTWHCVPCHARRVLRTQHLHEAAKALRVYEFTERRQVRKRMRQANARGK